MTAGRTVNTLSQNWGTPKKYVDAVKCVLGGGIDLDPCSNEYSVVEAKVEYSLPKDDGLKESWNFPTIFVNPPYGIDKERQTSIKQWLYRCAAAHKSHSSEVIALIPVATNTGHWKKYVFTCATAICFLYDTRLRFLINGRDEGKGAPMSCAMVYWGVHYERFLKVFSDYGAVLDLRPLRGILMSKYLIVDIETSGLEESKLADIMPVFEPSKALKDPEKIKADLEGKKAEWMDKTALDAKTGYIVAMGVMDDMGLLHIFHSQPESDLLKGFWELWRANPTAFIVGHNIVEFDIPYLIRRSWINDIDIPHDVIHGRYLASRIIDTMKTWACCVYGNRISLNDIGIALGVGKKSGGGKDFAKLLKSNPVEALKYLENDLTLTRECAKKMRMI